MFVCDIDCVVLVDVVVLVAFVVAVVNAFVIVVFIVGVTLDRIPLLLYIVDDVVVVGMYVAIIVVFSPSLLLWNIVVVD